MPRRLHEAPDRRHIETFLAVIDHGGFAAAGRHLGVSQSAVAQSLRRLEALLGADLFVRSARPFRLTPAGRLAEPYARRAINDLESFVAVATQRGGSISGRLTICTIPTMSAQPVARLVGTFRAAHPRVRVDITQPASRMISDVPATVRTGLAEVGITEFPTETRGLRALEFDRQAFVAVLPPTAAIDGAAVDVVTFQSYGLIVGPYFESSVAYSALKRRAPDLDSHIAVRTDHRDSFVHLAAEGLGATLVHRDQSDEARRLGCIVVEFDPPLTRRAGLIHPTEYLSPAASAFVSLCRDLTQDARSG